MTAVQTQIVPITREGQTTYEPPLSVCPDQSQTSSFPRQRIAGLRDIDRDGIPDYIVGTNPDEGVPSTSTSWKVAFGTGVGFTDPVMIPPLDPFELSFEQVDCRARAEGTSVALTTRGLYDIDGDGVPEVVALDFPHTALSIFKHRDNISEPLVAGRLIAIDNGYGARTRITYRSAKQDATTDHHLPFPEVVVELGDDDRRLEQSARPACPLRLWRRRSPVL